FTQIDVEASFVVEEDIFRWMEGSMAAVAEAAGAEADIPFPRLSHAEAMERFGIDRPDLRFDLEIQDYSDVMGTLDSNILRGALDAGGRIRGLHLVGGAALSRRQIEGIEAAVKAAGAPGLLWAKVQDGSASGPLGRFFTEGTSGALGAADGDLLLVAAGADRVTSPALAAARTAALRVMETDPVRHHAWLWVTEFPVFEDAGDGSLAANHHPFVQPHPDDVHLLDSDPLAVRGQAYDLVYNGTELGSGSIRVHDASLQRRLLGMLGLSDAEIDLKFGFLLEALKAGAPPHGGIALGIDRLTIRLGGGESLRDAIAFPKTTASRALFEGAPSPVPSAELAELGLELSKRGGGDG
ncbi:MAG: hypothetical protein HKN73_02600, partial [Gemmatimonadetes bacterium]|nr:hypothetical protein [Gemmatimonadota bacterium]